MLLAIFEAWQAERAYPLRSPMAHPPRFYTWRNTLFARTAITRSEALCGLIAARVGITPTYGLVFLPRLTIPRCSWHSPRLIRAIATRPWHRRDTREAWWWVWWMGACASSPRVSVRLPGGTH